MTSSEVAGLFLGLLDLFMFIFAICIVILVAASYGVDR